MTTHIMLDIETLGTRPGCVVLSAALVRFADEAITSVNLAVADQELLGLTRDPSTVDWWAQQSPESKHAAFSNPVPVIPALQHLSAWIAWAGPDPLMWCHGATFDAPILDELYRRAGLPTPWPYYGVRCTRTLYDLAGVDVAAYRTGAAHVASNDALAQTRAAKAALTALAKVRGL